MKYIYRYGILVCCTSCANCDDGHSEQKHAQSQNNNPSKLNKKEIQDPENIKKEFLAKFNDVINNFDDKKQNSNNKSDLQDADIEKLRELDKFIGEKYDDIIEIKKIKEIKENFNKLFFFCIHNKQEQFCNILKYLINNEYTLSGNMSSIFRNGQFETERSSFIKNFDCEIIKLYFDHVFHQRNPKTGELEYIYLQHNPDLITDVFECGDFDKVKLLVDAAPDFITSADKINSLYRPIAYRYALYYSITIALKIDQKDITTNPFILDYFLPSLNSEQTKYFFDKYPEYKISAVGLLFYLYKNVVKINDPNNDLIGAFEMILSRFEAYDELLGLLNKNKHVKSLFEFIYSCCFNVFTSIYEYCENKNEDFANALLLISKGN